MKMPCICTMLNTLSQLRDDRFNVVIHTMCSSQRSHSGFTQFKLIELAFDIIIIIVVDTGCCWTCDLPCPDMGQFDATKGKQALEIRSSLSERRALTDPILPGDNVDLAHTRSLQWSKAHGEFANTSWIFKCLCSTGKPPLAHCSSTPHAQANVDLG